MKEIQLKLYIKGKIKLLVQNVYKMQRHHSLSLQPTLKIFVF